jgi:methylated-DNA-[protein]-cysteine S-methyltransferase
MSREHQMSENELYPGIFFDCIKTSPIGDVWIAVNEIGVVSIQFDVREDDLLNYLVTRHKIRPVRSRTNIENIRTQIQNYLDGKTTELDIPYDLRHVSSFQRRVLETTIQVPRGQVTTYAGIAQRIGNPKAYRAVGQALRCNPIPIIVPCHRVISSDGTLGGYEGRFGNQRKVKLLKLEGVMLA